MSVEKNIGLVATDLDGTLLRNDKSISPDDLRMLELLGERNILRVVATGRNLKKVREVIPDHVPFDYVAFSSGAGIYDCLKRELIYYQNIQQGTVNRILELLITKDLNFHLFRPVPNNFRCWYHRGKEFCHEFERYFGFHNSVSEALPNSGQVNSDACQFLVMFRDAAQFHDLKAELEHQCEDIKVLRASSPLDSGYVWMEIFHRTVSKGNAIRFLCEHRQILPETTFGIGNDYNDLDLLDFTSFSYLTDNGPEELKARYRYAPSNEENAFSVSLKNHL
ncbi:HAD family hydrolase [Gaoshiqia sediminis]|uniref:HAD family hydrolase n=1 Tax=Gaoshiqia sediminis TaxID=2986998 RepID=A0AA41Y657_9BACT|nr:HAD-IIB family hydrolase [Gaoshiqia sediminis]MCW0484146.1 HAD family hydrolase [Gaoshiqia sediminis]